MYLNSETHTRYQSMRSEHILTIQIEYYRKLNVMKVLQRWFLLVPTHSHYDIIMSHDQGVRKLPKMLGQKAKSNH